MPWPTIEKNPTSRQAASICDATSPVAARASLFPASSGATSMMGGAGEPVRVFRR
jgi:hypothetical protein